MARHIVFLLHGMGQHEPGWSVEGIAAFEKVASAIGYPERFSEHFQFEEINYNHLFDQYLQQHKAHTESLASFVERSSSLSRSSFYKGLYDYASNVPDNDDFVVTSLGDVFLYRATDYEQVVISFVKQKIGDTLNQATGTPEWSAIGHSLGTRVLHDALASLQRNDDFISNFGKASCIGMMANVCLLLAYRPAEFWAESPVYPDDSLDAGGCYRYVNAAHPLDPFMWARPFRPPESWGKGAASSEEYADVNLRADDLRRVNPHSFAGYLEHPAVAAALCNGLGTRSSTSRPFKKANLTSALATFRASTPAGQAQMVREDAQALLDRPSRSGFKEFVSTLREFEQTLNGLSASLTAGDVA